MENKIFVGSGKSFGNYGGINISLCQEDLQEHWKQSSKNGKHYINLTISKKKNTDQYGNTHYVAVNTYQGKGGNSREEKVEEEKIQEEIDKEEFGNNTCSEEEEEEINPDDIPF